MGVHDELELRATPEKEDFGHKYTEEGQGKIGAYLIDGYFNAVADLLAYAKEPSVDRTWLRRGLFYAANL